jgi:hypothetical protein
MHDAGRQGNEQTDGNDDLDEPHAQPATTCRLTPSYRGAHGG